MRTHHGQEEEKETRQRQAAGLSADAATGLEHVVCSGGVGDKEREGICNWRRIGWMDRHVWLYVHVHTIYSCELPLFPVDEDELNLAG
jgi:hypothetical protein